MAFQSFAKLELKNNYQIKGITILANFSIGNVYYGPRAIRKWFKVTPRALRSKTKIVTSGDWTRVIGMLVRRATDWAI